jgi:hypothetical protein
MPSVTNTQARSFIHYFNPPATLVALLKEGKEKEYYNKVTQYYSTSQSSMSLHPGTTFNVPEDVIEELEANDVFAELQEKGLMIVRKQDELDTTVTDGIKTLAKDKENPVWQYDDNTKEKIATVNKKELSVAKAKQS